MRTNGADDSSRQHFGRPCAHGRRTLWRKANSAYVKTVWTWPPLLRSNFAEAVSGRPDRCRRDFARRWRQEGIRLQGERGIRRQPTAQEGPGCFRLHLFSCCAFFCAICAQRATGASRHPVLPAPSSQTEGEERQHSSGMTCRENAEACLLFRNLKRNNADAEAGKNSSLWAFVFAISRSSVVIFRCALAQRGSAE